MKRKRPVPYERGKRLMRLTVRTLHLRLYGSCACPTCGKAESGKTA